MGCAGAREKIEDKMMLMKLERMEVQMEKEKRLKQLSELEGHAIKRNHIPDYIDPKFAREKQIYDDDDDEDDDNENIGDKKTDDVQRKIKKDKNDKKAKGKNDKKEKGKNDKKEKGKNDKKKGKKDVDKKKVKKK